MEERGLVRAAYDLASQKLTMFEATMTTAMEDLAKKFDGFEALMTQALDKLSGLEA